jgi:DNA-binding transcriptional LysR family regulator
MAKRDLDLNLLLAFEALFKAGSVTGAARRLGVGQPAMSASLARLRTMLGDPLFEPVGRVMQPSPAARDLAPELIGALDAIRESIRRRQAFAPAEARRCFTVASTDYTSLVLAPGLVRRVRAAAPGVSLRVIAYDKDDVAELLDAHAADVVLGVFPDPPVGAVSQTLYRETFVGVARTDHPAVRDGAMSLSTFAALPHALVTVRRDARGFIDDALEAQGLSREIALTLPHMMALPEALADSEMVAALPERMATRLGPSVCRFRLPLATEPWTVGMLWNPSQRRDPGGRWLRGLLQDVARAA